MEDSLFGNTPAVQETFVMDDGPQHGIKVEDIRNEPAPGASSLPAPSQMPSEESILLREWRRKKAVELEEKAKVSREKHEQVIADAKIELEAFAHKREMSISNNKTNNKEKEKTYVENLVSMNSKQGANYWESVCSFINFEAPLKKEKPKGKNDPVRTSTILQEAKPGKHTDLARMRQVLLKLKHNPPKSFSKPAPAPAAAAS